MKSETKEAMALVGQFELLAPFKPTERKNGKQGYIGWQKLAIEVAGKIILAYPVPGAALANKKSLLAELKNYQKEWLVDEANYFPVLSIIRCFRETVNLLFAVIQAEINKTYLERVDSRSSDKNRIECDMSIYLQKAFDILQLASSGASKAVLKWEDVSCALAIVSGRRQSEIHYSAVFEVAGTYELYYSGQLKGKNKKVDNEKIFDHVFTIPTLIPARLVVGGLEWLEREGKRLDRATGSAEQVNKTWGKYLSRRAKSDWEIIPDDFWKKVDIRDKWTYHKLRGIYYSCCLYRYLKENNTFFAAKKKALEILGDSDHKTLTTYERVEIKPGSLTRID